MKPLLILILSFSFSPTATGQSYPDTGLSDSVSQAGFTNKVGYKNVTFDGSDVVNCDSMKLAYCSCDSLPAWGWNLYDTTKRIKMCGHFINGKLFSGLKFIYTDDGKLLDIEKYYNGKKVGNCDVVDSKLKQYVMNKCKIEGYIDWTLLSKMGLDKEKEYREIWGNTTAKDKDDCSETDSIIKDSSDYFLIIPYVDNERMKHSPIWIKNVGQMKTSIKFYNNSLYKLYADPDSNSIVMYSFSKDYHDKDVTIIHCTGNWMNVDLYADNKHYKGWVHKSSTCPLRCTTCD